MVGEPTMLISLETEEIMKIDGLSADDKGKLIRDRDKLLKNTYNWVKNPYTKTAYTKIKNKFGVMNDLFGGMGLEDKTKKDMNFVMRDFEQRVNNLSRVDQADGQKILSIGDAVIKEYDERVTIKKEADIAKQGAKHGEQITAELEEYNGGIFGGNRTFLQQAKKHFKVSTEAQAKKKLEKYGIAY